MTEQEYIETTNLRTVRDAIAVLRNCLFMDNDPLKALFVEAGRTLRNLEVGLEPRIKIRQPRESRE